MAEASKTCVTSVTGLTPFSKSPNDFIHTREVLLFRSQPITPVTGPEVKIPDGAPPSPPAAGSGILGFIHPHGGQGGR
jgi:hypothetical protein